MTFKRLPILFALLLALGLTACSDGGDATSTATTDEATSEQTSQATEGAETITIEPVGNEMKYATTEFTVAPGQEVTIVFENTATSAAMQHNVVLLNSEDAINRVGQAAMGAADNDYIPEDEAILAYTPMAAPGETVEVTFTAPEEPGDYPYICTFPGHYMMMQGTMTVE